jgi:hypothetical protein
LNVSVKMFICPIAEAAKATASAVVIMVFFIDLIRSGFVGDYSTSISR